MKHPSEYADCTTESSDDVQGCLGEAPFVLASSAFVIPHCEESNQVYYDQIDERSPVEE